MVRRFVTCSVICCVAVLILLISTCRLKPDGGIYWTFITYEPVLAGGDGSGYETAYRFKKGQAGNLANAEVRAIRQKYGVGSEISVEQFNHHYYSTRADLTTNLNGRAYHIITFTIPAGTNAVYFDVTNYRQNSEH